MDDEFDDDDSLGENGDVVGTKSWAKGVADPDSDSLVNIWSLNGFGQPVLTGGMYQSDEARTLEQTIKNYCASKNVSLSQLCGGEDHTVHNKSVRGAWQEIAQCLPHRTVLSVYRRALRQCHSMTRGAWSKEEVASLFNLADLHGHRWKIIQDKLGRSATDCRVKFFDLNEKFQRGKWSVKNIDLLLRKVRAALHLPKVEIDVREINQWTLEHNTKIPWTAISYKVKRKRQDCYFKWKQMTKRSNKMAVELGLEPVPMARESLKFDVREEYSQWKAEQDPKSRQKYAEEFVMPLLQKEIDGVDSQKEHDIKLLDSIIESRATRPSEVSWHTFVQRGEAPRERWEILVDKYATDNDMDLQLWKLARVVKSSLSRDAESSIQPDEDSQLEADPGNHGAETNKKRKREKKSPKQSSDSSNSVELDAETPIQPDNNKTQDGQLEADHRNRGAETKKKRKRKKKSSKQTSESSNSVELDVSGVPIQQP
mmetsp:Transcript_62/g.131  ORF Transcript_62/g.131 Transcript_62/m.131 type:complete len:483 (-) Transcript_62:1680-3128(-)|eukprot:CAMPEP_0172309334 /NCGR_PEP_ID=MMETSP1058-20130122/9659_1 /TAXON_ID=83371 /ORGANISM="Detonula confervacea, Strain CCMP 353" /LENGTH=482 /DNA_ID=CAMNT_0013021945 /DNA_START=100 /DNA_END=1548 /DNA_ORIENTATION=-